MKHSHIDPKSDLDNDGDQENFLSRWSRRKSEARRGEVDDAVDTEREEQTPADEEGERQRVLEERNKLTDEDMPSLDSLDENSDFSPFLSENVSEDLRRLALRQMFRLPKFGVLDGLNDYDEDYTIFEPLGDTITADMRFHAERKEAERKRREEELAAVDDRQIAEPEESAEELSEQDDEDLAEDEAETDRVKQLANQDELEDSEVLDG